MVSYFISDLHLSPATPRLTTAFYAFLDEKLADADALYILGDFFDAWIGDDEDDPYYLEVQQKLATKVAQGLPISFVHGNRDFLIGDNFAKATGVTLLPEQVTLEIAGRKALLMHGDSLCTDDTEYMAFRAQVRSPQWQAQVLSLPLAQRRAMAAQMRSESTSMNSNKAEDILDVNSTDVEALFASADIELLLHGHTHRPARHKLDFGERVVLGDWNNTGWYVRADKQNLDLVEFNI